MPVAKKERTDHKCLWQRKKDQTTNAGSKRKMAALLTPSNVNTQFLLQSVCVEGGRELVCLFFHIISYINCFGRTVVYVCIEYHI